MYATSCRSWYIRPSMTVLPSSWILCCEAVGREDEILLVAAGCWWAIVEQAAETLRSRCFLRFSVGRLFLRMFLNRVANRNISSATTAPEKKQADDLYRRQEVVQGSMCVECKLNYYTATAIPFPFQEQELTKVVCMMIPSHQSFLYAEQISIVKAAVLLTLHTRLDWSVEPHTQL